MEARLQFSSGVNPRQANKDGAGTAVITPYKERTDEPVKFFFQIQSCRHAVRVLDIADVSQRDWNSDQLILYTNLTTKLDHVVLIGFASTTQTWEPHELNYIGNYFELLDVLLDSDIALDSERVWKYYGEPNDWDPVLAFICIDSDRKLCTTVKAKDMFPFISSTT